MDPLTVYDRNAPRSHIVVYRDGDRIEAPTDSRGFIDDIDIQIPSADTLRRYTEASEPRPVQKLVFGEGARVAKYGVCHVDVSADCTVQYVGACLMAGQLCTAEFLF